MNTSSKGRFLGIFSLIECIFYPVASWTWKGLGGGCCLVGVFPRSPNCCCHSWAEKGVISWLLPISHGCFLHNSLMAQCLATGAAVIIMALPMRRKGRKTRSLIELSGHLHLYLLFGLQSDENPVKASLVSSVTPCTVNLIKRDT